MEASERFIGYFSLVDACPHGGCPICRCLEEDGRRHLDAIMYEQVNDPDTRRRLRASWGFCNWHTWMLLDVANSASGAAIVCEDVIRLVLRRARRLGDGEGASLPRPAAWIWRLLRPARRPALAELHRRRPPCPVCAWSAEVEASYVRTTLRFIDDPQFARAYAGSDGLCIPHMLDALERGAGTVGLEKLFDRTLARWEELGRDLDRFVGKHDYRNTEPFTDEEASSYRRAYETLAGRRGVYGNDLHGALDGRRGHPAPQTVAGDEEEAPRLDEHFEHRQLELRVRELTTLLNAAESRAAALHYRLSQTIEDRNALELNLAGERGTSELAMRTIADLRAENERLRAAVAGVRGAPLASPGREV
jgi:hypothetical protein